MLPTALSEVLGIILSEVMRLYFDGLEDSVRACCVEEALDRQRLSQEGEEWLAQEASRLMIEMERDHERGDDTF
jgi:hypothetical protein